MHERLCPEPEKSPLCKMMAVIPTAGFLLSETMYMQLLAHSSCLINSLVTVFTTMAAASTFLVIRGVLF